MSAPHEPPDGVDDLGRRVLEAQERFELVLRDGQRWSCRLLSWGRDDLLVQTANGRYLVRQQAIAYVVLEEDAEAVLREAATVAIPELTEGALVPAAEVFAATAEQPDPPIP